MQGEIKGGAGVCVSGGGRECKAREGKREEGRWRRVLPGGSLFSITRLQVLLTLTSRWPLNGRSVDGPPLADFQEESDTPPFVIG